MAVEIFTGNVIAVIWDFDQTLIPGYMQAPLFEEFHIPENEFWDEVEALVAYYAKQGIETSPDTIYLSHLLTYVRSGPLSGLTNSKLRELGAKLRFYPGLPRFLEKARQVIEEEPTFQKHSISVEHYIVSTGLRQIIKGSAVAPYIKDIWACEFIEEAAAPGFLRKQGELPIGSHEISQVGYFLDNTTKTRAIWEINKGTNVDSAIKVNSLIAAADRRVPLRNMLYVADGPSDIPVFSILNSYGGRTLGVYNPSSAKHYEQTKSLQDQGRVQYFTAANYRPNSEAHRWILVSLREMAQIIVRDRERALVDRVKPPAQHVT